MAHDCVLWGMIRLVRGLHCGRLVRRAEPFRPANLGKNLANFDILASSEQPQNNIEMIQDDSILFTNLSLIKSPGPKGEILGCLLLHNETFEMNFTGRVEVAKHIVKFDNVVLQIFKAIFPKPDLLVIGLGSKTRVLDSGNKAFLNSLGMQYEMSDSKNAALNYDLLATERGWNNISALILPPNF